MFKRLFSGSRMTRECHVRFCEGFSGKFRRSTHHMRTRHLLLMLICVMPIAAKNCDYGRDYDADQEYYIDMSKPNYGESATNTILPGAFIGFTTGLICAFLDHHYPKFWPLTWLFLGVERMAMVHALSHDMHNAQMWHKKKVMEASSVLAAWVTYLITLDHLHHKHHRFFE
jgi:hypothetical protein